MSRVPARPPAHVVYASLATLLVGGCANITPEQMDQVSRIACIAGTFLSVAANNFGAQYLNDAARIVSLFSGASFNPNASSLRPGCSSIGPDSTLAGDPTVQDVVQLSAVDVAIADDSAGNFGNPENESAESSEFPDSSSDSSAGLEQGDPSPRLDLALLREVQGDGSSALEPIGDGYILWRDAGDKFQVYLSVSETSYVYIYAVDATAWMQRLHPDPERGHLNPVQPGERRALPRPDHFYGLDEYKGNQEIWFLVSPEPRPDVDELLAAYPLDRERPDTQFRSRSGAPAYDRISKTTVFSRGLVEVGPGEPATVQAGQGEAFEVTPARLFSANSEAELAFSRWFTSE